MALPESLAPLTAIVDKLWWYCSLKMPCSLGKDVMAVLGDGLGMVYFRVNDVENPTLFTLVPHPRSQQDDGHWEKVCQRCFQRTEDLTIEDMARLLRGLAALTGEEDFSRRPRVQKV